MIKKTVFGLLLVIVMFIGLSRLMGIAQGHIELLTSYLVYPFLRLQKVVTKPLEKWKLRQYIINDLLTDLKEHRQNVENLQQQLVQTKAALNQLNGTQELTLFNKRYTSENAVIAKVLLRNFDGTHFYLIDGGTDFGIEQDMIAVYKDCLVGRVIESYPRYAKVLLITDPLCKVAAYCVSNNEKGIHQGMKKVEVTKLTHVNPHAQLILGDLVLSSGEGGFFPRGFGLGTIRQWETDGYSTLVYVTPLADLKMLDYCTIVDNRAIIKLAQPEDRMIFEENVKKDT